MKNVSKVMVKPACEWYGHAFEACALINHGKEVFDDNVL